MNITHDILVKNIVGHGFIEKYCVVNCWRIRGFFSVGAYTHLNSGANIWNAIIGRYSRVDANVVIGFRKAEGGIFSNHYFAYSEDGFQNDDIEYSSLKSKRFYYDKQPITFIGHDVRIHQGSIIFAGVNIGVGAIIYPNSVVDSDVPAYAVVAGNPAKIIKYRFSDKIIKKLIELNWYNFDLSALKFLDMSNVREVIAFVESNNLLSKKKVFERFYVNSYLKKISNINHSTLVIGPSHIDMWQNNINSKKRDEPGFMLFGVNGLSLYSTKLQQIIDWFLEEENRSIVLFIPDFRIGNVILGDSDVDLDPLFIYKGYLNEKCDIILYKKAIKILDELACKYKNRIKFVFWCLMGREFENKKSGKYLESNGYKHPVWNYLDIKKRYSNNILEIPGVEDFMDEYIIPNNTIHPNELGYDVIEKAINNFI